MLYLKVKKQDCEKKIKQLKEKGLVNSNYKIIKLGEFLYIPIKKRIEGAVELEQKQRIKKRKNLKQELKKILKKEELKLVKRSYDIIGDIAIIEIPKELEKKEKIIANKILEINKRIKSVFKKKSALKGIYRVREVEFIAGESKKETIHKENGCQFKVNIEKVYFSPRLSFERKRIQELVKNGENILAMFAGVGPFPIVIQKKKKCNIIAIEINPYAVKLMKENIKLNRLKNIKVIEGDVKNFEKPNWADRILMPLPKDAELFLPYAFKNAKNGSIIHIYTFEKKENAFENAISKIKQEAKKQNISITILNQRIVRPFSPDTVQVVIDFRIKKQK